MIDSNHITSDKIATPSPVLAAMNRQIEGQAFTVVELAIEAVRTAASVAGHEAGVHWETLLRASVTTHDAMAHRKELERIVGADLAAKAIARLFAPLEAKERRTKRAKP